MRKVKFKAGDKVYCPSANTKISIVGEFGQVLALTFGKSHIPFDEHGMSTITKMPVVFHATAENHALLEKLYGVKFEAPPKQKTPKEIIQAMLDDGWQRVPCLFTNENGTTQTTYLKRYDEPGKSIPFDPKTGKIIIDYVDGEIVTE